MWLQPTPDAPASCPVDTSLVSAERQEQLDAIASIVYTQSPTLPPASAPPAPPAPAPSQAPLGIVPSSQPELDAALAALSPSFDARA